MPLHYFFLFAFWKMGYCKLGVIAIILINLQNIHMGEVKNLIISLRMCHNLANETNYYIKCVYFLDYHHKSRNMKYFGMIESLSRIQHSNSAYPSNVLQINKQTKRQTNKQTTIVI